jgi:hypothetical protein
VRVRVRACDKISTVKHSSSLFHRYVKMLSQKQNVSTQIRGDHQAGVQGVYKRMVRIEKNY